MPNIGICTDQKNLKQSLSPLARVYMHLKVDVTNTYIRLRCHDDEPFPDLASPRGRHMQNIGDDDDMIR